MEGFYALAFADYEHLAKSIDWKAWLETIQKSVGNQQLQLLDVACGSGKFPSALLSHGNVTSAAISPIDYALLDPSSFSISETRKVLASPFQAGVEYEMKLQDLECDIGFFDVVWATHALYAIPQNELEEALRCMMKAIGNIEDSRVIGSGFIAHAKSDSHYLEFFKQFLQGFRQGIGEPFTSSEQIISALTRLGLPIQVKEISYTNGAPEAMEKEVERYLQRCVFDESVSLRQMLDNPITGSYLESCRKNGMWQFSQNVEMIFINAPIG
ncbi:MAG: hypothetical protein CMM25_09860 [Rhodospirillaceae bacterium]|nr:hypothetical protein [Rhodospirillaceae bacterium]